MWYSLTGLDMSLPNPNLLTLIIEIPLYVHSIPLAEWTNSSDSKPKEFKNFLDTRKLVQTFFELNFSVMI